MKASIVTITLMCLGITVVGLMVPSQSTAEIDPGALVGLWLFDDAKGDTAVDGSGNGLDAELHDGPEWIDGVFGKALQFDGAASYAMIPDHDNPTEAITVSIWVKSDTPTWNQHGWVFEKRNAYMMHPVLSEINMGWIVCNGACWNLPFDWQAGKMGPDDSNITEWHMYTGTFDSDNGEWKLYIDGDVVSELELNKAPVAVDDGPIYIGQDTCCPPRFGAGAVDEAMILNVALAEADVKALTEGWDAASAVNPAGKLTTTWGQVRAKR